MDNARDNHVKMAANVILVEGDIGTSQSTLVPTVKVEVKYKAPPGGMFLESLYNKLSYERGIFARCAVLVYCVVYHCTL